MISTEIIIAVTASYLAVLFYIAYRGDTQAEGQISRYQPLIYTLSLTVYCTSWTFFGAVGNAAQGGLAYFSIYLGPILVFVFFYPFLKKLVSVSKRQKTTTIADFIATRYGKSNQVAALVTLIALVGTLPYISLQIKAIASAYDALTVAPGAQMVAAGHGVDTALALSVILALFAILFGARTIDATVHHRGMMQAISFESVVKRSLVERIERAGMQDLFGEILVPTEEVVEMRGGSQRRSERKFFPGYVLVQMEMTDEAWHLVKDVPKVMGFIGGTGDRPAPITDREADAILQRMQEGVEKPRPKVLFEPGEVVRVIDGPFNDFNGVVEEVDYDKSRLKVSVLIFGRSTPVDLEFGQVEKG